MNSSRNELQALIEQNRLAPQDIERAAHVAGIFPTSSTWLHFLDRALLMLGCLAFSISLLFFVAYNWLAFDHFAKFALVESVIVLATVSYVFSQKSRAPNLISQASLLVASLSLGILLALFGQTYQTGADPWQLFFNWALLMLPWLLLSRSSWLWLFWCVLLNISLVLWMDAYGISILKYQYNNVSKMWATLALNAGFILTWELASNRFNWLKNRWAIRSLVAFTIYAATAAAVILRLNDDGLAVLMSLLFICGAAYIYRKLKPDLLILTLLALSVSIIALTILADFVFSSNNDWLGSFLFMSLATLGLGSTFTVWLKNIHKDMINQEATS